MELVLQIVGGVVVSIILIVVAIFMYFKIKHGKYLNLASDDHSTPLSIHLNEDFAGQWLDTPAAKKLTAELTALGFTPGKAYLIYEMNGYFLQAFINGPIVAVLYWHEIAGNWIDMVIEEVEGKEYTYSNAQMGGEMSERPDCFKEFDANASAAELYARISKVVNDSSSELLQVDNDGFRAYFEASFKKDISWKNRNGGISYEEFLATSDAAPFSSSDKNIKEAFIEAKVGELEQWHNAVLNEYLKSQGMDEDEVYNVEYNYLIAPFKTNASAYIHYLSERSLVKEEHEEKLSEIYKDETDIIKILDRIIDAMSPDLRPVLVESVDYPLPIKLYKLSDKMHRHF